MPDIEFMKLKITQNDVGNTLITLNGVELTTVKSYSISQDKHNFPQIIIELISKTPEIEHLIEKNNLKFIMNKNPQHIVDTKDFVDLILAVPGELVDINKILLNFMKDYVVYRRL